MTNPENIRYCPKCKKTISPDYASDRCFLQYSWVRLELPYFFCGDCRLASIDKTLIQKTVSEWRKNTNARKTISHKDAYQKALKFIKETVQYHKVVRFNKTPRK